MTAPPRVLVTGAAGSIGSTLVPFLAERFPLRLADLRVDGIADGVGERVALDIRDLDSCRGACADMDVVVHLAADPNVDAPWESLLPTNIVGTYNMFRAAADEGCRRMVYASSINAISGYPLDVQAHPETPVRPGNLYGVSKCFGEALAAYFAHVEGLPSLAVRIGFFTETTEGVDADARTLSAYVGPDDLRQLLLRCIEAPDIDFAIVHGVSNNRFKRLDLTATRRLIGYRPREDAFQLFGTGLRYRDRWYTDVDTRSPS